MAKRKFKFTDLADDQVVVNNESQLKPIDKKENESLEEIKEEVVLPTVIEQPNTNLEQQKETLESINENIVENSNTFVGQNTQDSSNLPPSKRPINYDVDYSEYEEDNKNISVVKLEEQPVQQPAQNTFNPNVNNVNNNINHQPNVIPVYNQQQFNNQNSNFVQPNNYVNNQQSVVQQPQESQQISKRTQLKTYSSVLQDDSMNVQTFNNQYQYNPNERIQTNSSFVPEKVKDLISFKEKLDVKTNIYLKSSIVVKLKELENRTNESRSSIINKLLEFAIKNMEE